MLQITGGILLIIGTAAGATLVASPFALAVIPESTLSAWVLFPMGFVVGTLLIALGGAGRSVPALFRVCAGLLLALAVASLLGLSLPLLGVFLPTESTLPLWYVLVIAGMLGTVCALRPESLASPST